MQVAEGGSEVSQFHPLLPPAPLFLFECSARKPCSLLYQVALIVHPCMLLSSWVFFHLLNKQAVRFFTLQRGEGGGGVLGILYWLECEAKVSSASALEELKQINAVMESLREGLEGKILAERAQAKEQADKAQQEHESLSQELKQVKVSAQEQCQELER
ncbi:hypothetical protein CY35_01G125800 [Sphagnum magellanicum]|nr:hypothetical protein CY35_01G125800 [Sphagnum magellanicum]